MFGIIAGPMITLGILQIGGLRFKLETESAYDYKTVMIRKCPHCIHLPYPIMSKCEHCYSYLIFPKFRMVPQNLQRKMNRIPMHNIRYMKLLRQVIDE